MKVYGPVAMYCDVADPACAAMIEKAIPTKKLYGKPNRLRELCLFVCRAVYF